MTAAEIAGALGNARREGRNWRCICPLHGGCSLTLRDGRERLLVRCWAGCGTREVLAELRRIGLIGNRGECPSPQAMMTPVRNDNRADTKRRVALARRVWGEAGEARGTTVAHYLASRGITIPLPRSLRWAPACPHPSGIRLPAMVAKVVNIDGDLIGVHRTFLQPDGSGKADIEPQKASLGAVGGGAVRLATAAETLMVGEGLETCLAAMQATSMPTWAALSTAGMVSLQLPPIAREIIILADHDANGAGERAAYTAACRWLGEGRRVSIAIPPKPGTDFADLLVGHAYSRIDGVRDAVA
jgi:phage/plasmid primase-like uncharacterized protein